MRRIVAVALAAAAAACSRDTSLPPPPGAGSIQGRVVYAVPGQSSRVAAAGARVTVLGTSIGATAGSDGRFVIGDAALSDGDLLVQADLDGNGTPDRQTLLSLAALGAKPGRDLALGDVVVVENARVRGRVLRADVPGASGHAGTVVFVAQGPFTTLTGDDGSYVFENLPEGRISLTFFRDGYDPQAIDGVQLRAGEDFAAREVSLSRAPPSAGGALPGAVAGQLTFSPPASGAGARVTAAQVSPDPTAVVSALASPSGAFQLPAVPPGLYRLEAARAGYVTAIVSNVMVGAGTETRLAISLAAQGVSAPAPDPVAVPSCVSGVRCDLPNGCQVGQVSCATGSPVCAPIGNALDGLPCGVNQVCSAGACVSVCVAGASCRPPADPCREGVVSCATGTPACVAGTAPLANGTACGANQVCSAGACTTCFAGLGCTPLNPCDTGLTECGTGTQTCRDTGLAVADGTSCGAGLSCALGVCAACQAGRACAPAGFPCHGGVTSCATGREVCVDTGALALDGIACGADRVCRTGACLACTAGATCTPPNPCHAGVVACGTGLPVCVDQQASLAPGATCGADHVCDGAGACVACAEGQACAPPNPCHAGGIRCASGAPVCGDLGAALADGRACGTDQVCLSGTCVPCTAGVDCTPANPCHEGRTSCATGASTCGDTARNLADGATCGTNQVCRAGVCGACVAGAACDGAAGHASAVASPDPCKSYGTFCATGAPTCGVLEDRTDGTSCPGGTGWVCRAGTCTAPGYGLRVAANGLGAQRLPDGTSLTAGHAYPDGSFVVTVEIVDVNANPVLTGQTITATAPTGAVVSPASASTGTSGRAAFTVTGSHLPRSLTFTFAASTAFAPLPVTVQVDAPPDGMLVPVINAAHAKLGGSVGGPAATARTYDPAGLAVASDGTIYYSEWQYCTLWRLGTDGVVQQLGAAGCGFRDGPLASALFGNVGALLLDERDGSNPALYAVDYSNNRIRRIWLASGQVETFAGDGATSGPDGIGDGNPRLSAHLSAPGGLAIGADGAVYVGDTGHDAVRRIDPAPGGVVTTVLSPGASCAGPLVLSNLSVVSWDGAGSVAFDEKGSLFVSGRFCGGELGASVVPAVVRVNPDRTLSLVAGWTSGTIAEGASARSVAFAAAPSMAFDRAADALGAVHSNLYLHVSNTAFVRVEPSGRISVVAGTPEVTGASADFVPATSARFNGINGFAFRGADLLFADEQYGSIHAVAGVARARSSSATLGAASAASVNGYLDQTVGPLVVRLTDDAGAPLFGWRVPFAKDATALPGGWTSAATAATDTSGYASVAARPGLAAGVYRFVVALEDVHGDPLPGSPVAFTVNAAGPPAGTVFTVVNASHLSGNAGAGGPAVVAQVPASHGIDLLPDGALLFTSNRAVWRVDPSGVLSVLAGTPGVSGYTADGAQATTATFGTWVTAAADRARQVVYVSDNGNHRVRAVDLRTGVLTTVAGTGAYSSTGDGGLAAAATIGNPERLFVSGGSLYARDYVGNRIRRIGIDPTNAAEYGYIFAFLQPGASTVGQTTGLAGCTAGGPLVLNSCGGSGVVSCAMAADPLGALYLTGYFCGGPFGATADFGIARIDPGTGALQHVAGLPLAAAPATGLALGTTRLPGNPAIAFDPAGRLWMTTRSATGTANVLGWADPDGASGRVSASSTWNLVGTSTPPTGLPQPDYVPAGGYWFGNVFGMVSDAGGHLYFTDSADAASYASNSVRVLW